MQHAIVSNDPTCNLQAHWSNMQAAVQRSAVTCNQDDDIYTSNVIIEGDGASIQTVVHYHKWQVISTGTYCRQSISVDRPVRMVGRAFPATNWCLCSACLSLEHCLFNNNTILVRLIHTTYALDGVELERGKYRKRQGRCNPSIIRPVYSSVHSSTRLSVHLFARPVVCPYVRAYVRVSFRPSARPSVRLRPSVRPSVQVIGVTGETL